MDEEFGSNVKFVASLPAIQSAITISGNNNGAVLKLEIPETHADVIPLIQMYFSGVAFVVTLDKGEEIKIPRSA